MTFKWLTIPFTNQTREIQVAQLWEVRWQSRYNEYAAGTRPEMEAFVSEEQAIKFADSLKRAFALIRHTSGTRVTVTKAK